MSWNSSKERQFIFKESVVFEKELKISANHFPGFGVLLCLFFKFLKHEQTTH